MRDVEQYWAGKVKGQVRYVGKVASECGLDWYAGVVGVVGVDGFGTRDVV